MNYNEIQQAVSELAAKRKVLGTQNIAAAIGVTTGTVSQFFTDYNKGVRLYTSQWRKAVCGLLVDGVITVSTSGYKGTNYITWVGKNVQTQSIVSAYNDLDQAIAESLNSLCVLLGRKAKQEAESEIMALRQEIKKLKEVTPQKEKNMIKTLFGFTQT